MTYVPRVLGYFLGERVNPDNIKIFIWMEHVAYAIVFSVTFRLIVLPTNDLKEIDLWWRIFVTLLALSLYLWAKRFLFAFILLAVVLLYAFQRLGL